jgi:cytochrome b
MIWLLLASLLVLVGSGIALDAAENFSGPLKAWRLFLYTDRIAWLHASATDLLTGLVVLHVAGVAISSRLHRENLVTAMFTGRKPAAPAAEDA